MNEDEFWDAIGLLNRGCGGDDVAAAEPLVAHLAALPNGELFAFDDALAEHLRALDRRDVADRVFGPFRDRLFPDEFLGWRCACVAGGKDRYEGALAGSSTLPASVRFEELAFAPMRAWAPQARYRPRRLPPRAPPRLPDLRQRGGLVVGRPALNPLGPIGDMKRQQRRRGSRLARGRCGSGRCCNRGGSGRRRYNWPISASLETRAACGRWFPAGAWARWSSG